MEWTDNRINRVLQYHREHGPTIIGMVDDWKDDFHRLWSKIAGRYYHIEAIVNQILGILKKCEGINCTLIYRTNYSKTLASFIYSPEKGQARIMLSSYLSGKLLIAALLHEVVEIGIKSRIAELRNKKIISGGLFLEPEDVLVEWALGKLLDLGLLNIERQVKNNRIILTPNPKPLRFSAAMVPNYHLKMSSLAKEIDYIIQGKEHWDHISWEKMEIYVSISNSENPLDIIGRVNMANTSGYYLNTSALAKNNSQFKLPQSYSKRLEYIHFSQIEYNRGAMLLTFINSGQIVRASEFALYMCSLYMLWKYKFDAMIEVLSGDMIQCVLTFRKLGLRRHEEEAAILSERGVFLLPMQEGEEGVTRPPGLDKEFILRMMKA